MHYEPLNARDERLSLIRSHPGDSNLLGSYPEYKYDVRLLTLIQTYVWPEERDS
jgi:hypothetical protein